MMNNLFARWADFVTRLRWPVLGLVLALSIFFGWSAKNHLIVENDLESFFPADQPQVVDFKQFSSVFGLSSFIFILVETEDPLSLEKLKLVDRLTTALETEVPYIEDVVSPTNAEILVNADDMLTVAKLRDKLDRPDEFAALLKQFIGKDIYRNGLISADGKYLGILMNTISRDLNKTKGHDVTRATAEMTAAVYEILERPEYKSLKLYAAGNPIFNDQYGRWTTSETNKMFGLVVLLLFLLLLAIFRNVRGVSTPFLTVVLTVLWTFGIMALSMKMRVTSTILPPLLASVGIGDSIHILTEFDIQMLRLHNRRKAVVETIRIVGYPCLLTSLTTSAGFLSLAVTPVLPLFETGIMAGIGVMLAFVLNMTMVIALLSLGGDIKPEKIKDPDSLISIRIMDRFFSYLDANKLKAIFIWAVIALLSFIGIDKIVIDADWLRNFGEDIRIRADYEKADSVMGGSAAFEVMIDTGEKDGVKDPVFLKKLQAFQDEVLKVNGVHNVLSVNDLLREVRVTLQGDSPESRQVSESREMAAQLMLLYDMAGGKTLEDVLDGENRRTRVSIRTPFEADSLFRIHYDAIAAALKKHIDLPEKQCMITGYPVMELALNEMVLPSQIYSFVLAFVAVGLMLIVFLRSLKMGLTGMIPTTSPIFLALGFMGFAGIYLDWVITMIASVGIGLSVDNAIHLFNRFRIEFEKTGNHSRAMRMAIRDCGRALAFSAFILVIGFGVTGTSVMENVANFGKLSALLIGVSFLTAVSLAPPLLVLLKPFGKDRSPDR